MRITLVFPSSLCYPNPIYYALPVLAGALVREGHSVRQVDLNVLAADRLLTREGSERILTEAYKILKAQASTMGAAQPSPLESMIRKNEPGLLGAPRCKEDLRNPEAYLDPARFRTAFHTVMEALNFCYLLDPIIPVFSGTFIRDILAHQQADPWTPLRDLHDEFLIDEVLRNDPEMIGITVPFYEQVAQSISLAAKLRRRKKDLHICFGGILLHYYPEKWLENGWIFRFADSIVVGGGETAIVELAEALEGKRGLDEVRNLVYLDGERKIRRNNEEPFLENMDLIPVPDFDSADLSLYLTPEPIYPVMTSRGCYWGQCAFCSSSSYKGFRVASKEKVRTDMLALSRRHGARYVMVQDSGITPRSAMDLARIIKEESLPVNWVSAMRIEKIFLNKAHCRELAEGGCRTLMLGFESSSQRLLDLMNKGYDIRDLPAMLDNLKEAGISSELLWFLGFPTETRAEVLGTARFLVENRKRFGMAVFVGGFALYQDTILFEKRDAFGIDLEVAANGLCRYRTKTGMNEEEKAELARIFGPTSNLILSCNGAHLPHLVENGLDLSGIENPMFIPEEAVVFCTKG
ncbi:MAG: radical SAM protein [Planctomycetota bacterium]